MEQDERPDYEQQAQEERRRFLEANPGYEQCLKHPERAVVDSSICTKRFCAECIEDRQRAWADHRRLDAWRGDDRNDMRDYSDHPRYERGDK